MSLMMCTDNPDGSQLCRGKAEELVIHDQALFGQSAGRHMTLNELGDADVCVLANCGPGIPATVCARECSTSANERSPLYRQQGLCSATVMNLSPEYVMPEGGKFSCLQERKLDGASGQWTDILVQHDITVSGGGMFSGSKQEVVATGLFFREGSYSKAHVTG